MKEDEILEQLKKISDSNNTIKNMVMLWSIVIFIGLAIFVLSYMDSL